MKNILFLLVFLFTSCCGGVKPTPTNRPDSYVPTDSQDVDLCDTACNNLYILKCSEGEDVSHCTKSCKIAQSDKITNLRPGCLSSAKTKEDARLCGSVKCP